MRINNLDLGYAKPVGVELAYHSMSNGGVVWLLKKKMWLRIYHMVTFQCMNTYLTTPAGRPVMFNKVQDLESMSYEGIEDQAANDSPNIYAVSRSKMKLSMLCLCPWTYSDMKYDILLRDRTNNFTPVIENRKLSEVKHILARY